MAFQITDIDVDNTVYHEQVDVDIHMIDGGTVTGLVSIGGIFQTGVIWTSTIATIPSVDVLALGLGPQTLNPSFS